MHKSTPLFQIHTDIDERVRLIREGHPEWLCGKGCDSCCRCLAEVPRLTAAEWEVLQEGLATLPPEQLADIGRHMLELAETRRMLSAAEERTRQAETMAVFLQQRDPGQPTAARPQVAQSALGPAAEYAAGAILPMLRQKNLKLDVVPLKAFYDAESYHQDYLVRPPDEPYIVINDQPKVAALKKQFPELWVEK